MSDSFIVVFTVPQSRFDGYTVVSDGSIVVSDSPIAVSDGSIVAPDCCV